MANIEIGYSNFVGWTLQSEIEPSIKIQEPTGWREDGLKLSRHKDYHGMFFTFTGSLIFKGEAMDYIERAFNIMGINAKVRLTKYALKVVDGEVKVVQRYSFLADFNTRVIKDNGLNLKWNNFKLAELIKSHESDEFEIERVDSIDGDTLVPLKLDKTEIPGRLLNLSIKNILLPEKEGGRVSFIDPTGNVWNTTVKSKLLSSSDGTRFSSIDSEESTFEIVTPSCMFYQKASTQIPDSTVNVNYDLSFVTGGKFNAAISVASARVRFIVWEWDGSQYNYVSDKELYLKTLNNNENVEVNLQGYVKFDNIKWNQGIALYYTAPVKLEMKKQDLTVSEISHYESTPSVNCIFTHDLINRLIYIITGENDVFISKYFGRTELGYVQDGVGALMAHTSGLWLRGFTPENDEYKSYTTSLKKEIDSLKAVHNIGIEIRSYDLKEVLRFEKLEYFYRDEVVVKFPYQLNKVERKTDSSLYFSGMEFGYEISGDYESQDGLDEPNVRTSYVTPIRASKNKYNKLSKDRADDQAMELTRRKPQSNFPYEDTKRDNSNFLLDLKRTNGLGYTQKIWSDRLKSIPLGIFSPETWKGMFFTPMRMALRHSWVYRAGMEPYLDKKIKYISSSGNKNVITHAKDDWRVGPDIPLKESDDILVNDLKRAKLLPEIVTAEHAIDDKLWDWIIGTTPVIIDGEVEEVPNYYFKMQFINEKGLTESGYLLDVDPSGNGKVSFQICNENLI